MKTAAEAWTAHAEHHPVKSRGDFVAGFEAGAFEERLRLVSFISESQETLNSSPTPQLRILRQESTWRH